MQTIDLYPFDSGPHPLTSSLLLVSPSEWDQHLHDLITRRGEEQFVFVLWPYGPISRVTTPQSLQATHAHFRACVCMCGKTLETLHEHLTPPPVATFADEASSCTIWPATTARIVRLSPDTHMRTHTNLHSGRRCCPHTQNLKHTHTQKQQGRLPKSRWSGVKLK